MSEPHSSDRDLKPDLFQGLTNWALTCGKRSLELFCAGIFPAFLIAFLIEMVSPSFAFQLLVSVVGIVTMTAVAHYRTRIRNVGSSSNARSRRTV